MERKRWNVIHFSKKTCNICHEIESDFNRTAKVFKHESNISFIKIDCDFNPGACKMFSVYGIPKVIIVDRHNWTINDLPFPKVSENFIDKIEEITGIHPLTNYSRMKYYNYKEFLYYQQRLYCVASVFHTGVIPTESRKVFDMFLHQKEFIPGSINVLNHAIPQFILSRRAFPTIGVFSHRLWKFFNLSSPIYELYSGINSFCFGVDKLPLHQFIQRIILNLNSEPAPDSFFGIKNLSLLKQFIRTADNLSDNDLELALFKMREMMDTETMSEDTYHTLQLRILSILLILEMRD